MSTNTKLLRIRSLLTISAAGVLALMPLGASALSTLPATMAVTATIVAGCTAVSATTMAFGATLAPGATPAATDTVSTTCSTGIPATLSFGNGLNAAANVPQLKLTTNFLAYNLYSDASHTTALTGAAVPPNTISLTGTGVAVATTIYGLFNAVIPADQFPGAYTDTIAITLSY